MLKEPLEGERWRDLEGRSTPSAAPEAFEGGERDNLCMTSRLASPELVGRQPELTEFAARLETVRQSSGSTILVGGDAGIGKTRLIGEACTRAKGLGYLTAIGACMPAEGRALPHASVVGLLRDLERQLEGRPEVETLRPAMEAVGMSSARTDVSPAGLRARRVTPDRFHSALAHQVAKTLTYEVLAQALVELSSSAPLIAVFEDVHWADTFTLGLLDYLSRNLASYPILLVASYRSDEPGDQHPLRQLVAELLRIDRVARMELAGLEGEELEALMAALLGHRPKRVQVDTTSARTGGNPFFVEELLTAGADDVPDDLQEVVVARVRRLAEPCRRMLDAAAVIGSRIGHLLLAHVSDLSDDHLDLAIAEAVGTHLLVVDDDRRGYRFHHDLVREAVYSALLPGERARFHHRVATALTAHPELVPEEPGWREAELATHWWEAGVWIEALPACAAAATAEAEMFAFSEAQLNLTRALLAWDRLGNETASSVVKVDRAALLEQAADAAYFADSLPRAMELARQSIEAIDGQADPKRKAMAYVRLGRFASNGDLKASLAALEAAARLLPSGEPSFELSQILSEQACTLLVMSRFEESHSVAERAIEMCRAVGNRSDVGTNHSRLGVCLAEKGRFDEAVALSQEAVAIAEEIDNAENLRKAYNNLVHVHIRAGRLEEAAAVTLEGLSKGEQLVGVRLQHAALNSIDALILLGRWEEAGRLLDEIGDRVGGGACGETHSVMCRATLYLRQGRFAEARAALGRVDELIADLSDLQFRGTFYMLRAELALEESRPADAYRDVELALAQAAGTDDQATTCEICALGARALADQRDEARQKRLRFDEDKASLLAAELSEKAQMLVDLPRQRGTEPLPRADALALQCRAEAIRLSGSDAAASWEESVDRWDGLGGLYDAAYCRLRQAEALLVARSKPGRAAKVLLESWRTSMEIGAKTLQAKAETLAQRARVSLDVETPQARRISQVAHDLGLTSREVEVLGYLASGKTDGQIAEGLFISKKTASVHVSNLLRKLDVESRYAAAEIGRQHEISADPTPGVA